MNSYCNNCGKIGHAFHQCKSPITSHGIIAFRDNPINSKKEYLLIRRKDTLGFVDFMRGKYSIYNKEYILNMINQMTNDEKARLITDPFSKLWEDLWGICKMSSLDTSESNRFLCYDVWSSSGHSLGHSSSHALGHSSSHALGHSLGHSLDRGNSTIGIVRLLRNTGHDPYKAEEQTSRNKFESLKSGVYTKTDYYNLEDLIRMTNTEWVEPEWGFPKGRRNYQESDYDCSVREFCEETGYSAEKIVPLKNIQPFEEIFMGSNYKSYKHKYYVTYMRFEDTLSSGGLQASEVSESRWMEVSQCFVAIRHYNVEKKRLLAAVDKMLSDNCLSSIDKD